MTKAREIIGDALTFRLNKLSPGETLDQDTARVCLDALNSVVDEINGKMVTRRTRQVVTAFATLDASYNMPPGYRSALSDLLAERLALPMVGRVPAEVQRAAAAARVRMAVQTMAPAIIHSSASSGDILNGWA